MTEHTPGGVRAVRRPGGQVRVPEPGSVTRPVQRGRAFLIILTWLTAGIGVIVAIVVASFAGNVPGASLSLFFAILPLPVVLWAYWWLDRVEPEPRRYKFAAFLWGAVVAVAIAVALEAAAVFWLDVNETLLIALVAPVVEELAKGLFLFLTLLRARKVLDGVLDGLVLAGLVAIGFAAVENVGYYAAAYFGFDEEFPISGAGGATATFVVRGLFSPFAHPLFTSMIGIALGLAVHQRSRSARWAICAGGILGSVALHALWNGSLVLAGGAGFIVVYIILAVMLVGLATVAVILRNRQFAVLRKSLNYIGVRGWLHPAEIPFLVEFDRRRQARKFARTFGGREARRVTRRYQELATELAFSHHKVMQGRANPSGVDGTYAVLDEMYGLRPALRLPPALPPGTR